MLFCSYVFILAFLPLTLLGYYSLNRINATAGRCYLLAASFVFYGYFNYSYLLLLLGSLVFNYAVGGLIERYRRRWVLILGCTVNLLLLGYYKYYDFFVENVNALFGADLVIHHLILPLGISFFTFQQISYLSDVYHRVLDRRYSLLDYALFVSFFPQLIAGPIVLANEMMPQFARKDNLKLNYGNFSCGIFIFSLGLAKKMLVADNLALVADRVFALSEPCFADSLIGSLAYALQLYFDFSGYSDMAIGIGAMFNIMLPVNFLSPFRSANIQDFWRRWHITLGRFLAQFVYRPLGGNKKGVFRTGINLMVTFLLCGLWHSSSWLMILWGGIQGLAIILHRIWSKGLNLRMPRLAGVTLTFVFSWLTLIFYRAENVTQLKRVLGGFGNFAKEGFSLAWESLDAFSMILLVVSLGIVFLLPPANSFRDGFKPAPWHWIAAMVLLICSIFCFSRISPFIYFNF